MLQVMQREVSVKEGIKLQHSDPETVEALFRVFSQSKCILLLFFFGSRKSNVVVEARQVAMRIFEDYTQSWHWILLYVSLLSGDHVFLPRESRRVSDDSSTPPRVNNESFSSPAAW